MRKRDISNADMQETRLSCLIRACHILIWIHPHVQSIRWDQTSRWHVHPLAEVLELTYHGKLALDLNIAVTALSALAVNLAGHGQMLLFKGIQLLDKLCEESGPGKS